VGRRGDDLIVVESKRSFSGSLKDQLLTAWSVADYVIAAVGTYPREENLEWCRKFGVGLWVMDGGVFTEWLTPNRLVEHYGWSRMKTIQMFDMMESRGADNVGGVPTQLGIGPAIECSTRCEEFIKTHPGCSWKNVFAFVPNHYASAASMASAMRRHGMMDVMIRAQKENGI